jgi:HD superfamily phosphohydrolase YqeK
MPHIVILSEAKDLCKRCPEQKPRHIAPPLRYNSSSAVRKSILHGEISLALSPDPSQTF